MSLSDQEIADALVENGIGEKLPDGKYRAPYEITSLRLSAAEFMADWRTAGLCLERMGDAGLQAIADQLQVKLFHLPGTPDPAVRALYKVLSNPRAICEAFAESQS